MTKVSQRILNRALEDKIFELFTQTIIDLKEKDEVSNFLEDLLSPSEKIMLVKRLAIAILLKKGYTYDAIDETLKVSRPTIMHVAYRLKYGKGGYEKVVEQLLQNHTKTVIMDMIEEILIRLTPPKKYASLAHQQKSQRGKELFARKKKPSLP